MYQCFLDGRYDNVDTVTRDMCPVLISIHGNYNFSNYCVFIRVSMSKYLCAGVRWMVYVGDGNAVVCLAYNRGGHTGKSSVPSGHSEEDTEHGGRTDTCSYPSHSDNQYDILPCEYSYILIIFV